MTRFATLSDQDAATSWPLPEPTLAYFPDARFAHSDRDLGVTAARSSSRGQGVSGGVAVSEEFGHVPVLVERCFELLAPALTRYRADGSGAVLVDATLGAGGHSQRFLSALPCLRVIGLDRDPAALEIAGRRLRRYADRITMVRTRYDGLPAALHECGYAATRSVDAVLFDLGVSSMQLDRSERGFSYSVDAPLDMRMDPELPMTAADLLNTFDQAQLTRVLREFGEERFAARIAAGIVRQRRSRPFVSTAQLVALLYETIPAPARRTGGHPAKRTFQALRVAVNGELDSLRTALPAALDALAPAGCAVVLAYQSLEDRIVKTVFAAATASRTPPGLPVELPGHGPEFEAATRGAERANAAEIESNQRSAAVRLRAVRRLTERGR
jgi:16S rRNA (cytosine1402-N4)-methyltransferase